MENASKALIIAGSVLLAVLIIIALIYTFSQISSLKQVEASSEEEKILTQYDKEIESFNRQGLYGSEILSLANLVEDYNKRQSDLKGYKPITLKVSITQIIDAKYLKETQYSKYGDLIKDFKNLFLVKKYPIFDTNNIDFFIPLGFKLAPLIIILDNNFGSFIAINNPTIPPSLNP